MLYNVNLPVIICRLDGLWYFLIVIIKASARFTVDFTYSYIIFTKSLLWWNGRVRIDIYMDIILYNKYLSICQKKMKVFKEVLHTQLVYKNGCLSRIREGTNIIEGVLYIEQKGSQWRRRYNYRYVRARTT